MLNFSICGINEALVVLKEEEALFALSLRLAEPYVYRWHTRS